MALQVRIVPALRILVQAFVLEEIARGAARRSTKRCAETAPAGAAMMWNENQRRETYEQVAKIEEIHSAEKGS
jgi:hypothetical protein